MNDSMQMDFATDMAEAPLDLSAAPPRSPSALTKVQGLALLQKLATDDDFRARYEEQPAAALIELGISEETVANLSAACLAPARLAGRDAFKEAHLSLTQQATDACLTMVPPQLKLDFGRH